MKKKKNENEKKEKWEWKKRKMRMKREIRAKMELFIWSRIASLLSEIFAAKETSNLLFYFYLIFLTKFVAIVQGLLLIEFYSLLRFDFFGFFE